MSLLLKNSSRSGAPEHFGCKMHGVLVKCMAFLHDEPRREIACKQANWCKSWKAPKSVQHMTPTKTPIGEVTGALQEHLSSGAKQGCKLHKKLEAIYV